MAKDPLHGLTLEVMLQELVAHFGWADLGERIPVKCFTTDPSITSSLKFLRRTPWARTKVEGLYGFMLREKKRAGIPSSQASGSTPAAAPTEEATAEGGDVDPEVSRS